MYRLMAMQRLAEPASTKLLLLAFKPAYPDRRDAKAALGGKPFVTDGMFKWQEYLQQLTAHNFVVVPHAHGLDTHRMWEALLAGCIPVTRRSTLDSQFEGLPVVFVDTWEMVTKELLDAEYKRIVADSTLHKWGRMFLPYWAARLAAAVSEVEGMRLAATVSKGTTGSGGQGTRGYGADEEGNVAETNRRSIMEYYSEHEASKATAVHAARLLAKYTIEQISARLAEKYGAPLVVQVLDHTKTRLLSDSKEELHIRDTADSTNPKQHRGDDGPSEDLANALSAHDQSSGDHTVIAFVYLTMNGRPLPKYLFHSLKQAKYSSPGARVVFIAQLEALLKMAQTR
jgi:hypothetical protein